MNQNILPVFLTRILRECARFRSSGQALFFFMGHG